MEYLGRVPRDPLAEYIDDLYVLTGRPRHRRLNVPPMPSAHLFINLGEPVRVYDSDGAVPPAVFVDGWFMGLWTRRYTVEYPGHVRLVGVHFKPWGMVPFIDVPTAELRDRWLPADALWGAGFDRLRDRAAGASSAAEALQFLEAELHARLGATTARGFELVRHTGRRLATTWGGVSVGELTDGAGVTGNHLAAQFKTHVGVTPKRVARIYRFARLVLSVDPARQVDWAELAFVAGYFDQAHLSKEFKDFTGLTPSDYLSLRRRFPAERGFPPDMGPMPVA